MRILIITCLLFLVSVSFAQEIIEVGGGGFPFSNKKGFVYGTIVDLETGEAVIGAIVKDITSENAIVTDINGDFRLRVPLGRTEIQIQSVGFEKTTVFLTVGGEGKFKVAIEADTKELDAVIISGQKLDANIKSTDVGKNSLSIESIKQLPMSMGEIDVIKSLTLLPGVSTNSELSTGFNVRGGASDQNLVLLGDVPIYNPAHLFGFYTAFNAEVIDDVALFKGGVPARYGGRASSVLHVKYRDGDYNKWKGSISAGVVSAKATIEGPIIKDKLSILGSVRRSYVNWMLGVFEDPELQESSADFYDVNVIANLKMNDRNKLTYAIYRSTDNFNLAGDTLYQWTNYYQSLNWYHSFSDNLSLKLTGAISSYENKIENESPVNPYVLASKIDNKIANADLEYLPSERLSINMGVNYTGTALNPGELTPDDEETGTLDYEKVQDEYSRELAFYVDGSLDLSEKFTISAGLRYNMYNYFGEHTTYEYEPYRPLSEQNIIDSARYTDGESIQTYSGFEPRLALRYSLSPSSSIKLGYNRMYQYIHLISNTTTIAPNDIWKLSDNFIKPQIAEQLSLGYYQNFQNNKFETSIEGFYKEMDNVIDYKDGADLFLNDHIESEMLTGRGRSYGLELYLRKKSGGRLTGWISYTLSRSERQIQGAYDIQTINGGDWYRANFDRTHNLSNVLIYKLPKSWEFSSTITFKTGQPVTYPAGKVEYFGVVFPLYTERNSVNAPAYHRLDISFTKKFKFLKKSTGEYNFSIYNVYGRNNAFSVFFQDVPGSPPQPYQLAVLGVPFPSMSLTLNF
jgi:hypothetical protein